VVFASAARASATDVSSSFSRSAVEVCTAGVNVSDVAVWRWDSIFPDRRDYANLVPLPISLRSIFAANLIALLLLAVVLAVDVNAVSALLFPLIVSASENAFGIFANFVWVHMAVVLLGSVFSFCAVFATVGALMSVLPYSAFRRLSSYFRALLIAYFVALLLTSFAVPPLLKDLPNSSIRFLPPVWFLGLCQLLRGRTTEVLSQMGHIAMDATLVTATLGIAIYAVAYRRCFLQIPETADVIPSASRNRSTWLFRLADRALLPTSFQRAAYRFTIYTMLRSDRQGLVFGGFMAFGFALASQLLFSAFRGSQLHAAAVPDVLAIPLALAYCAILGMRFAFDIPAELRANWIFRFAGDPHANDCPGLAQKVILGPVLACSTILVLPAYGLLWGWKTGIVHAVVVALCSLLLVRILVRGYRKIPFTCSYPPFAQSAVVVVLLYVLGFFVFVVGVSHLEPWIIAYPITSAVTFLGLVLLTALLRRLYREENVEATNDVVFDEASAAGFELLDLRKGG